jgi:hypothetical protein
MTECHKSHTCSTRLGHRAPPPALYSLPQPADPPIFASAPDSHAGQSQLTINPNVRECFGLFIEGQSQLTINPNVKDFFDLFITDAI